MEQQYHIPVLLNECIEALDINPDGITVRLRMPRVPVP